MITITDNAKERVVSILGEMNKKFLRLGVQGGGCHGFTYFFDADTEKEEDDYVFPITDDYSMVVDIFSFGYLDNAEIDYKKDLMGESFVFNNPNVKAQCGCANSVSFD